MTRTTSHRAPLRTRIAAAAALAASLAAIWPAASALAQMKPPEGALAPAPSGGSGASAPAPGAPLANPSAGAGSGPAGASAPPPQQDPMTSEFRDCVAKTKAAMEAKKQDDFPSVLACLNAETKRQETRMGSAVTQAARYISGTEKTALDSANTAWRRFRDANCAFLADPKSPMPGPLEHADCLLGMTVTRALEMGQLSQVAQRRNEQRGSAPAPAKK